jgi:hypothetical protein
MHLLDSGSDQLSRFFRFGVPQSELKERAHLVMDLTNLAQ